MNAAPLRLTTHTATAFRCLEAAGFRVTPGAEVRGAIEVDAYQPSTGTTVAIRVAPRSGRLTAAAVFRIGESVAETRVRGAAPAARLIRQLVTPTPKDPT